MKIAAVALAAVALAAVGCRGWPGEYEQAEYPRSCEQDLRRAAVQAAAATAPLVAISDQGKAVVVGAAFYIGNDEWVTAAVNLTDTPLPLAYHGGPLADPQRYVDANPREGQPPRGTPDLVERPGTLGLQRLVADGYTLAPSRWIPATALGSDSETGIALLRAAGNGRPPLRFDAALPASGERIVVAGYRYGRFAPPAPDFSVETIRPRSCRWPLGPRYVVPEGSVVGEPTPGPAAIPEPGGPWLFPAIAEGLMTAVFTSGRTRYLQIEAEVAAFVDNLYGTSYGTGGEIDPRVDVEFYGWFLGGPVVSAQGGVVSILGTLPWFDVDAAGPRVPWTDDGRPYFEGSRAIPSIVTLPTIVDVLDRIRAAPSEVDD